MRWGLVHKFNPKKIYWSFGFYTSTTPGFFIKTESAKQVGYWNLKYPGSSDYDFFYKMIVKHKMNGTIAKKNEVFGYHRSGGFSSKGRFVDWLKECSQIRLDNNQPRLLVWLIFIVRYIKNFKKIFFQYFKKID